METTNDTKAFEKVKIGKNVDLIINPNNQHHLIDKKSNFGLIIKSNFAYKYVHDKFRAYQADNMTAEKHKVYLENFKRSMEPAIKTQKYNKMSRNEQKLHDAEKININKNCITQNFDKPLFDDNKKSSIHRMMRDL